MSAKKLSLYEMVVDVATDYLGPAARRFIDRQIENHTSNRRPQTLSRKQLVGIIDWITISLSMLTEDTAVTQEFVTRLRLLVEKHQETP